MLWTLHHLLLSQLISLPSHTFHKFYIFLVFCKPSNSIFFFFEQLFESLHSITKFLYESIFSFNSPNISLATILIHPAVWFHITLFSILIPFYSLYRFMLKFCCPFPFQIHSHCFREPFIYYPFLSTFNKNN